MFDLVGSLILMVRLTGVKAFTAPLARRMHKRIRRAQGAAVHPGASWPVKVNVPISPYSYFRRYKWILNK